SYLSQNDCIIASAIPWCRSTRTGVHSVGATLRNSEYCWTHSDARHTPYPLSISGTSNTARYLPVTRLTQLKSKSSTGMRGSVLKAVRKPRNPSAEKGTVANIAPAVRRSTNSRRVDMRQRGRRNERDEGSVKATTVLTRRRNAELRSSCQASRTIERLE